MKRDLKERVIRLYEISTGETVYRGSHNYYSIDSETAKTRVVKWRIMRANYDALCRAQNAIGGELPLETIASELRRMFLEESEQKREEKEKEN